MNIIEIDINNKKYLEELLTKDIPISFRYFKTRPINVIKNHIITIILLNNIKSPIGYGHIDQESDVFWLGIFVLNEYQNRGYGKQIMDYILNHSKIKDISRIRLTVDKNNNGAISLYKKYNFKIINEMPNYFIMEKEKTNNILLMTIPIYKPYISNYKNSAIDAINTEWISNHGKYIKLTSDKLKEILTVNFVILMCNGTAATHCLFIALKMMHPNINKIYVPNNCYIAVYNCALMEYNAESIEVLKIDSNTWNMVEDKEYIESLDKNSAILVVHNLGGIVDVNYIKQIRPDIVIMEDNCEGLFGKYNNIYTGTSTETLCSSLSFYGNKTITSGEGGAFLTNNEKVYQYISKVYSQGMSSIKYVHDVHAYNYRMTNIEAALLYDQLCDIDYVVQKKEIVFTNYQILCEKLISQNKICLQTNNSKNKRANWIFAVRILNNKKTIDEVFNIFLQNGIEIRPFFYNYKVHKHLENLICHEDFYLSNTLNKEIIMLPSYPEITFAEQEKVISVLESLTN